MKIAVFSLVLASLIAAPHLAFATGQSGLTLSQMGPGDSAEGYYVWATNSQDVEHCGNNRFYLATTSAQYDLLVSLLLTAKSAQSQVYLVTQGCHGGDMNLISVRVL